MNYDNCYDEHIRHDKNKNAFDNTSCSKSVNNNIDESE